MDESILQTESLTQKRYGPRMAVDGLSLSVERGDIFGFLGQNGAGKSTVIRMALGLVRPTARTRFAFRTRHGETSAAGARPRRRNRRSAGFLRKLFRLRTTSGCSPQCPEGSHENRLRRRSNWSVCQDARDDPVRTYSHGMRQRLGIAQALLPHPEFIILDEPTDGLDPQGIHEIRLLLPRLRD